MHGYFFNPNIHPYAEYARRQEALARLAAAADWPVIFADDYRPEDYFRQVAFREGERCRFCYLLRLRQAARVARKGKFDAFTTTLLVSPYQKHDLLREIGRAAGEEFGVPFYDVDFRPGFREGRRRARELGLYRQQYCGCIFSERERFAPRGKGG